MGGHHKKELRAEKAKVKLKGAKLPKGLNVTKTEFKVRKILIRDQLKDAEVVDGKRQIDLKENIIRLKHYSVNVRLEALRNIREILSTSYTPGILNQLNDLIRNISALCLALEKDVRRETHKVLRTLLNGISLEKVRPFFHIISAYLRCAMTHVIPVIQDDSLLILDILLEYVPLLVVIDTANLVKNFLEMMSHLRADGADGSRTYVGVILTSKRALTERMDKKQTTITWRSNVLKRLQQILHTLVEYKKQNSSCSNLTETTNKFQLHTFNTKEPQYYDLKRSYASSDYTPIFNVNTTATFNVTFTTAATTTSATAAAVTENGTNSVCIDESFILRDYIQHLLPLLMEAWIEVRPLNTYANEQLLLTSDAAITLKIVLNIIQNLWELVKIHEKFVENNELSKWFKHEYSTAFTENFFHFGFPYQLTDTNADKSINKLKKSSPSVYHSEVNCLEQNINIITLISTFYMPIKIQKKAQKIFEVFHKSCQYLNIILKNSKKYQIYNYRCIIQALREFLLYNAREFFQIDAQQMQELLCATIDSFLLYKNVTISTNILILLCDIIKQSYLLSAFKTDNFENFLKYLPQHLLNASISEDLLKSMLNLAKQKNAIFLKALKEQIENVIENIQKIQINGALNAYEGKKHIMNLFYWIDNDIDDNECWTAEKIEYLVKKIEDNVMDKRILSYFKNILLKQ